MAYMIKFKGINPIPAIIVFSNNEQIESHEDINKIDDRSVLEIHFNELTEFETLMEAYRSDDALSEITIIDGDNEYIYYDYIIRISLSLTSVAPSNESNVAEKHWIMKLAQLTETDKRLRMIVDTINKSPATMTLEEYKQARIEQSKDLLNKYLDTHPLITAVKNNIFAPYNATVDKQNLFMAQFVLYYFNTNAGIEDTMNWNEKGKPCTTWTMEECVNFANSMKAYTKPLVSAQQQIEVDILALTSKADVEAYEIDYSKVNAPNGKTWWVGYTADEIRQLNDYYGITNEKPDSADVYLKHPESFPSPEEVMEQIEVLRDEDNE